MGFSICFTDIFASGNHILLGSPSFPSREESITATVLDGYSPRSSLPWKLGVACLKQERLKGTHGD